MTPFERLHKDVQRAIWDMGWKHFRPIQDDAITKILSGNTDLIISAPTAGGKTEAAFLPIISQIIPSHQSGVKIVCISPLKALINDQFQRISDLCSKMDIQVTKWHGDASGSFKKQLFKKPQGILLITPESLEALLILREVQARKIFKKIEYIVIDELHVFLGEERGYHLHSLLNRLGRLIATRPARICLSATLGDIKIAQKWLSPDGLSEVINDSTLGDKEIIGRISTFPMEVPQSSNTENNILDFENHLFEQSKIGLNLIFGNSKKKLEEICASTKQIALSKKFPDRWRIHHGSLSKGIREDSERELKEKSDLSVFCTQTLELGIDIGNIEKVFLLDPPWSVSSLIQRIGRSGRKDEKPINFEFLLKIDKIHSQTSPLDNMRYELVKSVALIELLKRKWCDPPKDGFEDYSVYVHQILAYIAQKGGVVAQELFDVINIGSFRKLLCLEEFTDLLIHLKKLEFIVQAENGDIILATKGEKLTEYFEFYSVFKTHEQWKIVFRGKEIGELPFLGSYQVNDYILLGGKNWRIFAIEEETKIILVAPSKIGKARQFYGTSGLISPQIHQEMEKIYEGQYIPLYADQKTVQFLKEGYSFFTSLIQSPSPFLPVFRGTKVQNTLALFFNALEIQADNYEVGFMLKDIEAKKFRERLSQVEFSPTCFLDLINTVPKRDKVVKKYDYLLNDNLLNKSYIQNFTDHEEAKQWINDFINKPSNNF